MAAPQQGRGAPPGSAGGSSAGPRPDVVGLNPCLTCKLCKGYLVDAMTLVKCLHSFCRSCILKHLETGHACPVCDLRLSKINVESHLMKDDTLQNVVYKAVPGLYQKEMKRRRDFYGSKGSKADQASLSPEQKGELDSSSSGRIIFSPDEAVSLSLEYKPIVDVKTEPEASAPGPSSQAFKEPAKRYLNCPAAVTIALLQKFLRMKYSISTRYKVDILYMDDVLWSDYMLMDVAYIYSWKRDMPLRLFYRVFESAPKPAAPVASTVQVPTSAPSLAQSTAQQSGSLSSCVAPGIDARAPTLSKSASVAQESRGCKKETTSPDPVAKPVEHSAPVVELPPLKPTIEASSTSIADPKVQSKINTSRPKRTTDPASVAGTSRVSRVTKTTTTPSVATQVCSVQQVPDIPGTSTSEICSPATTASAVSTSKGPSKAEAANLGAVRTASASLIKPENAAVPSESAASNSKAKAVAPDEPASCPLAKVPASVAKSAAVENVNSQNAAAPHPGTVTPAACEDAGGKPDRVCGPTLTFKANPAADSSSSARTAGFVMKFQPKVTTPTLNGIDKGLAGGLVKSAICSSDVTSDQVMKRGTLIEDVGTISTSNVLTKSPPSLVEDEKVEEKAPETKELQTCISRAAHKAEEKMNAIKAAAALVKESDPSEKDCKETSGGLSVTLRPNRISGRSHSEDSADKRPQKTSQADSSSKSDPPALKPPCRSATPPLPVIPSYLTLSKSHPSLFHMSPRKRGRPKLATVNSLNEEIERAHMMARGEMAVATATEMPVARGETTVAPAAEKPKPIIPVITSLKIKPIPPPPPQQPEVVTLQSPTAAEAPKDTQLRPRSKSQGDISEEKSSDAEDSIGRRKSRRKRPPAEQLKTMVTQLKELNLEKGQVATQEPLQSLPGGGTPGLPRPEQGQEKITLRVTRDEKCNLKVEKQLRPAVVSETLHDSGFCEDVVADSLASSPVPDPKPKGESIAVARTVHQTTAPQNVVTSTTSKGLELIGATRHLQHGTKRDLRKSKRKSVEDWVNEQSKWVRTHEVEAATHQGVIPPNTKPSRSGEDAMVTPTASSESKETSTKVQRRGRKRTNPVKITKPAPVVDAQQEKLVNSPARVSSSSAEAATPSSALPTADKELGSDAGCKSSTHSPRNSGSRSRQEPEHPKKSPELVIPRYIPNAATSVPLTVTHARNKRLRESRQEATAASGLDLSSSRSTPGAAGESPEKDSEKSKFFKEALNLSMKEAEAPAASCKDTCAASILPPKHPEEITGAPTQNSHNALPPASAVESKTVTKSPEQSPPNHGTTSQLSIIHQVVEKIASRNSCKVAKVQQDVNKGKAAPKGENQTNNHDGKCNPRQDVLQTSLSHSPGQPGSLDIRQDARSAKNDALASSLEAAVGEKAGSCTVTSAEVQPSNQSPKSTQAQTLDSASPSSTVGSEILPRINETGVFRLEFPAAELSVPTESRSPKEKSSFTPSSNSTEQLQSHGTSSFVGKKMSESVRNIVLVQESMMELRQGLSRAGSCGLIEARAKDNTLAAEKLSRTSPIPSKAKSPGLENCLTLSIKKELSSSRNNVFGSPSTHSKPQPTLQFPVGDVKSAREICVGASVATSASEVFSGSSKSCVRSKSAELLVKSSPPENRLSPIFGGTPILKMPMGAVMMEQEKFDPSKLRSGHVRSARSPVRSPLGSEIKGPSPTGHGSISSSALQNAPSPVKSPVPSEVKSANPTGYNPASPCGVSTVQSTPRPARSPVSLDVRGAIPMNHCIAGGPVSTTDVKVGKLEQEKGLWRPVDICTSRQLTEAALKKIAANKSISIGQVKDTRSQVPCRNRQGVALDIPQAPRSLSISIVTCNAGVKAGYFQPANQMVQPSQPLECLSMSRQLSIGNSKQADFLVKEVRPPPHCLDTSVGDKFLGCNTLLSRTRPELSVTSRSNLKSGIHIPASLSVYASTQQKSCLSPPLCKSLTRTPPSEEQLSPRLNVELEQPRVSPRPSDRVQRRVLAKDVCQPEGHGISSSNEVQVSKPSAHRESGMPSPRASENMYRTTVAEIDLFTTLSIIETMKGRATVHDIIDEYITNIGSFFCIMESLPAEGRRAAEVMCSLKEKGLLKVTALLKKVTTNLSSNQLSRALAVEALVQRCLQRCRCGHRGNSPAASTSEEEVVTSSEWDTSSMGSALRDQNVVDVKDEPPAVAVLELDFEFAIVPVLGVHFRHAELKRKALKRLKHGLKLRDLVGLRRKHVSSVTLPDQVGPCTRFLPKRPGGCFSNFSALGRVQKCSHLPQPTASLDQSTKSLARFLPTPSLGLPQSTVIVDALSSLLTGHSPNLVNRRVPRNGQCCSLVSAQSVTAATEASSSAVQAYREPGTVRNVDNILSVLSQLLSGRPDCVSSYVPQVVSHFDSGGFVPSTHHRQLNDGQHASCNLLLVEATAESSLVISSPQSNSKLVIGPDFDRQLLSRLLDRLKFMIPKTQGAGSWLNSVVHRAAVGGHKSRRMLTNCIDAHDERWPTMEALGASSCKAIPSVKPELVARPELLTRPELLAKSQLLVKPTVAVSRGLLQKRGALTTGICEVSPVQKRRRLAGVTVPGVTEVCSATAQRQRIVNACLPRKEVVEVVPTDCVVVLHRLELRDVEETLLKRKRCRSGSSTQPKKKPKLSLFPKAPSGVQR